MIASVIQTNKFPAFPKMPKSFELGYTLIHM